jgi:hypothetical protein
LAGFAPLRNPAGITWFTGVAPCAIKANISGTARGSELSGQTESDVLPQGVAPGVHESALP